MEIISGISAFILPVQLAGLFLLYMPAPVVPVLTICGLSALTVAVVSRRNWKLSFRRISNPLPSRNPDLGDLMKRQQALFINGILEKQVQKHELIASSLHESLGAMVSTARLHISELENGKDVTSAYLQQQFGNATRLLDTACDEIRTLTSMLQPSEQEAIDLKAALQGLGESLEAEAGLKLQFSMFGMENCLNIRQSVKVMDLIGEMVRLLVRHTCPAVLRLEMTRREGDLNIILEPGECACGSIVERNSAQDMFLPLYEKSVSYGGYVHLDQRADGGLIVSLDLSLDSLSGIRNLSALSNSN